MGNKHRKKIDKRKFKSYTRDLLFLQKKPKDIKLKNLNIVTRTQMLTETDQIRWVYSYRKQGSVKIREIVQIISVDLDIFIDGKWITIIYFDNRHGFLHKHQRLSVKSNKTIATAEGVKQKGDIKKLLDWCIDDLRNSFYFYKRSFLKRCNRLNEI